MADLHTPISRGQATALATLLEDYRIPLSKAVVALLLVLMIFTAPSWQLSETGVRVYDSVALVLMLTACLGRIWSTMYIGGQKNASIVSSGPYSVVRNPLYLFTLIGAVGIALMTHSIVISIILLVFNVGIYPFVVAKEEANLLKLFGTPYQEYCDKTPRFFPKLKLYSTEGRVPADVSRLELSLLENVCFVLPFIALSGIRIAQESGFIPVLFQLP